MWPRSPVAFPRAGSMKERKAGATRQRLRATDVSLVTEVSSAEEGGVFVAHGAPGRGAGR